MAQLIKKENITIITGTYTDAQGSEKKRYKTIAELITMQGDDGSTYQFGEMWGPHGVTKFNVYAQDEPQQNNNQGQQQQNQQQQNNGGFNQNQTAQQQPQQGFQNSHGFNGQNNG